MTNFFLFIESTRGRKGRAPFGTAVEYKPVDQLSYMFPSAVWIPGWHHVWNNICKDVCGRLPFFTDVLGQLKSIVRFFRHRHIRQVWSSVSDCSSFATVCKGNRCLLSTVGAGMLCRQTPGSFWDHQLGLCGSFALELHRVQMQAFRMSWRTCHWFLNVACQGQFKSYARPSLITVPGCRVSGR